MDEYSSLIVAMFLVGLGTAFIAWYKGNSVVNGFLLGFFLGIFGIFQVCLFQDRKIKR